MTSRKAQYAYYQWWIMEIQQVVSVHLITIYSSPHLWIDIIAVMITAFLIHMSVLAEQGACTHTHLAQSFN